MDAAAIGREEILETGIVEWWNNGSDVIKTQYPNIPLPPNLPSFRPSYKQRELMAGADLQAGNPILGPAG